MDVKSFKTLGPGMVSLTRVTKQICPKTLYRIEQINNMSFVSDVAFENVAFENVAFEGENDASVRRVDPTLSNVDRHDDDDVIII